MKLIDSLDDNIHSIFKWLSRNPINLLYSQKEELIFIIDKVLSKRSLTQDDFKQFKIKYNKQTENSEINELTRFVNDLALGLIENGSTDISRVKRRLLVLKDKINERKAITEKEVQPKHASIPKLDEPAPKVLPFKKKQKKSKKKAKATKNPKKSVPLKDNNIFEYVGELKANIRKQKMRAAAVGKKKTVKPHSNHSIWPIYTPM